MSMLLDGIFSEPAEAIGAGTNLVTQIATGLVAGNAYEWFGWDIDLSTWFITESTAYLILSENVVVHWDTSDWEGLGRDFTMIFSSISKNEPA